MPAYYTINLYKNPKELGTRDIIKNVVDALLVTGCTYCNSIFISVNDDSLPQEDQIPIRRIEQINLNDAIEFAINDLDMWISSTESKKWLSSIIFVFQYNFRLDRKEEHNLELPTRKSLREIHLAFKYEIDILFKNRITIDIDTSEDFILTFGRERDINYNKNIILKIVKNICNMICPHFGWLDYEESSDRSSYFLIEGGKWPVKNDYIVIGPQLMNRISKFNPEKTENFFVKLKNGGIILHKN